MLNAYTVISPTPSSFAQDRTLIRVSNPWVCPTIGLAERRLACLRFPSMMKAI